MPIQYTNNASAILSADAPLAATTISVVDASLFPAITAPDYAYGTLVSGANLEVVKITDITGTDLTCVRAQDNTTALDFVAGDRIELRMNTAMLNDALAEVLTATAADLVLTNADAAQTALDRIATAADRVQTGLDAVATAADAVSTAADVISTNANAVAASNSEANAAASAVTAAASAAGIYWKAPVIVATTADITLSGTQTIDGISVVDGDRVLVKSQTAGEENGIYICAAGAWTRATPLDIWDEFVGATVLVTQGTTNQDTAWICTNDPGGTVGTTEVTWAAFGSVATSITVDNFTDSSDYTSGTTTQLTLSVNAGSEENIQVQFDGITQHHNTYTLSGTTLTFSSAIPLGIANIEVRIGTTLGIGTPADGTVTAVKIGTNAVETDKINDAAVTEAKLADNSVTPAKAVAGVNAQTGTTYTYALTDNLKTVAHSNGSAIAATIPTNASVAFTADETRIDIMNEGAGDLTVSGDTGVTVNGVSAGSFTVTQYQGATLIKRGTDIWIAPNQTVA